VRHVVGRVLMLLRRSTSIMVPPCDVSMQPYRTHQDRLSDRLAPVRVLVAGGRNWSKKQRKLFF
jgi:hypothetical protein